MSPLKSSSLGALYGGVGDTESELSSPPDASRLLVSSLETGETSSVLGSESREELRDEDRDSEQQFEAEPDTETETGCAEGASWAGFPFTFRSSLLSNSIIPSDWTNGFTVAEGLGPLRMGLTAQDGFTFFSSSLTVFISPATEAVVESTKTSSSASSL